MSNELIVVDPSLGMEQSESDKIVSIFAPMAKMLKKFEKRYDAIMAEKAEDGITDDLAEKARRLRLDIVKVRTATDKEKKVQKADILRKGRAIDGVVNILKNAVAEKEESLREIENFFENQEKERLSRLQASREEVLREYNLDGSSIDLSGMHPDVWESYLEGVKSNFERAKQAEEARIKAEAEEAERLSKLREEAEKARAAAEAERKAAQERLDAQREENRKLQEKIDAQNAAEAARIKEEEDKKAAEVERLRQLSLAPDRELVSQFIVALLSIKVPEMKSPEGKDLMTKATQRIQALTSFLSEGADNL